MKKHTTFVDGIIQYIKKKTQKKEKKTKHDDIFGTKIKVKKKKKYQSV